MTALSVTRRNRLFRSMVCASADDTSEIQHIRFVVYIGWKRLYVVRGIRFTM